MNLPYRHDPPAANTDTSIEAAESIKPSVSALRQRVLDEIKSLPGSADEIATRLRLDRLTVRPR